MHNGNVETGVELNQEMNAKSDRHLQQINWLLFTFVLTSK